MCVYVCGEGDFRGPLGEGEGENPSASPNGPRKSVLLVSEGLNDSQNVL